MTISSAGMAQALQQLQSMAAQANSKPQPLVTSQGSHEPTFAGALTHSIDRIDTLKKTAAQEGHAFERGEPGISLGKVMIDSQKAGLATKMGIQVRNQVVQSYKTIMNMQV